ncbi:MAG: GyrI-like domain-containing protein [Hyphomicrobiaceae bacterium]
MSVGVVYMRPMMVAYVRRVGPHAEAGPEAWEALKIWLEARGLRRRVSCGYGLARHNQRLVGNVTADRCYDACCELPDDAEHEPAAGVDMQMLPGGAFLRTRLRGGLTTIGSAFSALCLEHAPRLSLAPDPVRPLVEVYFDNKPGAVEPYRVDLCLPVTPVANGKRRSS